MEKGTIWMRQCLLATVAVMAFQSQASADAVVENFVVIEATSLAPVQFCMPELTPVWRQAGCSPVSAEKYLQAICPGAILRSLAPTPYDRAPKSVAIGYEPPLGGCKPSDQAQGQ